MTKIAYIVAAGEIMALYTKKYIMTTFQEMLEEILFDKITVAALVKRAGFNLEKPAR